MKSAGQNFWQGQLIPVLVCASLSALPLLFLNEYFRDYSIVYDGAARIAKGLLPYNDFGIPTGPITFFYYGLLFKLFGASWYTLKLGASILYFGASISVYSIWKNLNVKPYLVWAGIALFFYSWAWRVPFGWYNTTAFAFEIMAFALLIRPEAIKPSAWRLILSGLLISFSFLSKQDFGALALAGVSAYLFLFNQPKSLSLKAPLWLAVGFLSGLVIIVLPFVFYEFGYWFNYGQAPHQLRLNDTHRLIWNYLDIAYNKQAILSILAILLISFFEYGSQWFEKFSFKHFVLVAFLFVQGTLTYLTSGLVESHDYAFAFVLVWLAGELISAIEYRKLLPVLKLAPLGFLCYIQVNPDFDLATYGINRLRYEFVADADMQAVDVTGYNGVLMTEAALNGAAGFNAFLDSKLESGKEYKILNTSEFTPSVHKKALLQPTGYPLWLDSAASFFPQERQKFYLDIKKHQFDMMFIQATHSPHPVGFVDSVNKYYYKTAAFATPRGDDSLRIFEPKP